MRCERACIARGAVWLDPICRRQGLRRGSGAMNHERFERLVLADAPLTSSEQEELRRHLPGCPTCSALRARWSRQESVLLTGLMIGPQAGFAGRWAARDAAQASHRERRQAWLLFGGTSIAASSLAVLVAWQAAASLPVLFADVLQQGLRWWIWARLAGEVTQAIASSLPTPAAAGAVLVALGLLAGAGLLSILGSFSIIRFSFQGVRR